jgi:nitroreductase
LEGDQEGKYMDVDTLLTTTRSVRRKLDLDRPVEREVVAECLHIAQQAPMGSGMTPRFHWLAVSDEEQKKRIAPPIREAGIKMQAAFGTNMRPAYGAETSSRILTSGRYLLDHLERVPVLIFGAMVGRAEEFLKTGLANNFTLSGFFGSPYPALWSLQLALHSRGLGSSLLLYHLLCEEEVNQALGVPDDVTLIASLAAGYTTQQGFRRAPRPPIEEITFWDRWGQRA